ncbi:MAG: NYN domain-containing protein [Candidatus Omnitrophica bacterium]|nr:NYN domain-containing protein [Candidatus Omnitrophota bacterium]
MNNYAFIDSQNLNLGIKEQGWKLDFKRFRKYLWEKYHAKKAFLFIGFVPQYQSLYTALQEDGYILVFKPTLTLQNGRVKGNVDAELVLHAMIEYNKYEKAVIVTGDGDFACLVKYFMVKDKLLRLIIPNGNGYSALLSKLNPPMVFMDNLKDKLERSNRQNKRGIS